MSVTPRIAPGGRPEVGVVNWAFAQVSGLVTGTTPPNLFLTLGRNRKLFRGWLRFAGRLMPGGRLPRRDTELVILRVAHLAGCDYEQAHHRPLAKRAGLTPVEIDGVVEGPAAPCWSDREHALLTAVDELHDRRDLRDDTWLDLRRHLDEATALEFLMLVGHYEMLATTINTLRIPLDRPRKSRRGSAPT